MSLKEKQLPVLATAKPLLKHHQRPVDKRSKIKPLKMTYSTISLCQYILHPIGIQLILQKGISYDMFIFPFLFASHFLFFCSKIFIV